MSPRSVWTGSAYRRLVGAGKAVTGGSGPVTPPPPAASYSDRGGYGTTLGNYEPTIPANAKYIDTVNGDDANTGTLASPWRTVDKALASGQGFTNVFRGVPGGSEGNARWIKFGRVRAQLTSNFTVGAAVSGNGTRLVGAPGESVGFDGSAVITGPWTQDGTTGFWWRTYTPFDWSPQDISSQFGTAAYANAINTDDWASLDGSDPGGNPSQDIYWQQVDPNSYFGAAAARPERMWMDGVQFIHVDKQAKLQPGRFWIDAKTNRHWIADNPSGHVIEFTVQQKLFNFLGYDQAFINLGVRRYADSMPQGGVLSAHRARFNMDHAYVSDVMAGLTLQGVNNGISSYDSQVVYSTFRYSKSIHLRGTKSDRVKIAENFFLNGNDGRFNPAPACGGVKFTYLRDTDIDHNKFANADLPVAPGITGHGKFTWFDAAVWRAKVRNNEHWYCGQRSFVLELTCDSLVFNNLDMFPGAESMAFVDSGGNVRSWNNTVYKAGRLRGQPETVINVGYWRGGVLTTVRDGRQRDVTGLTPPSYVYDGRESTAQWPGGGGNEAVDPLEPYPFQGNTPKSLQVRNNVYCRWDETAVYVDEEQKPSATGVSWASTGRSQDYNFYQPPTSYSPSNGQTGPNAGLAYLDNNSGTAVTAGTQAQLQALGLDTNSRFYPATDPDIVDEYGYVKNSALHALATPLPADLIALLPPGVTLAAGNRYAGRIAASAPAAPATRLQSGSNAAPTSLAILGDSIGFGAAQFGNTPPKYLNSWPGQLRTALNPTYGTAGSGVVLFNQDLWPVTTGAAGNAGWEPRMTVTGTITEPALGFHGHGAFAVPAGGSTFVELALTCTQFKLYLTSSATVRYAIDGGAEQTATGTVLTIPAGPLALHTLRFWGDTAAVTCWAWKGSRGDGRIFVDNLSISGRSLGTFLSSTPGRDGLAFLDTLDPDVVLIALGTNDYNSAVPLATAQANLATIISRVQANGGVALAMFPPQSSPTLYPGGSAATYTQYANGFSATCSTAGIGYLNLQKLWGGAASTEQAIYDAGNAAGNYADTIHPSDSGAADIAAAVKTFLGI